MRANKVLNISKNCVMILERKMGAKAPFAPIFLERSALMNTTQIKYFLAAANRLEGS